MKLVNPTIESFDNIFTIMYIKFVIYLLIFAYILNNIKCEKVSISVLFVWNFKNLIYFIAPLTNFLPKKSNWLIFFSIKSYSVVYV